ncbi:polymorphic toxin-type HINT domain-containing protein [Deinococcus cellulosilyticus]|uniref:Intein C-terminal splicing domain-containing protein n=1 Tax=Deinococcus cellulosilyticus (strain DSM 18568 / NBRC 106333 / KACC 11606 / 5516J-15) TaxID=1223518 RepID=A0A511N9W5_DEIC1|nr:polymorphic toxin-type HINT domain-containing protein [Deinococcus cellulosilyticus]GEM49288.1 hypothetical protein DC3_49230 [Deinococcus cellulosilyticus NBRC 106333 = KACC 11606]
MFAAGFWYAHPFYVTERSDSEPRPKPEGHPDLSDKWVGAGHLKVGDKLKQADGTLGEVRYVNTIAETRTMYNLEVEEAHTFFIRTQGWLLHNSGPRIKITADEIRDLNKQFGGKREYSAVAEAAIGAAERYDGFWEQTAAIVRSVAGGHMFDHGNKQHQPMSSFYRRDMVSLPGSLMIL